MRADGEDWAGCDGEAGRLFIAAAVAGCQHIGSERDEAELEALKAAARQRLDGRREELDLAWSRRQEAES